MKSAWRFPKKDGRPMQGTDHGCLEVRHPRARARRENWAWASRRQRSPRAEEITGRITDQGRYDDGVARLYRAVERHSVTTKDVAWDKINERHRKSFLEATKLSELMRARTLDRAS